MMLASTTMPGSSCHVLSPCRRSGSSADHPPRLSLDGRVRPQSDSKEAHSAITVQDYIVGLSNRATNMALRLNLGLSCLVTLLGRL